MLEASTPGPIRHSVEASTTSGAAARLGCQATAPRVPELVNSCSWSAHEASEAATARSRQLSANLRQLASLLCVAAQPGSRRPAKDQAIESALVSHRPYEANPEILTPKACSGSTQPIERAIVSIAPVAWRRLSRQSPCPDATVSGFAELASSVDAVLIEVSRRAGWGT
jgi:hypothetical protein